MASYSVRKKVGAQPDQGLQILQDFRENNPELYCAVR
jgi:hypothetical protein